MTERQLEVGHRPDGRAGRSRRAVADASSAARSCWSSGRSRSWPRWPTPAARGRTATAGSARSSSSSSSASSRSAGTAYLQAGRLEPLFVAAAIPVGALDDRDPRRQQPARHPDRCGGRQADARRRPRAARDRHRIRARCWRSRSWSRSPSRSAVAGIAVLLPVAGRAAGPPAAPDRPHLQRAAPAQSRAQGDGPAGADLRPAVRASGWRSGASSGDRPPVRSSPIASASRSAGRSRPRAGCGSSATPGSSACSTAMGGSGSARRSWSPNRARWPTRS